MAVIAAARRGGEIFQEGPVAESFGLSKNLAAMLRGG